MFEYRRQRACAVIITDGTVALIERHWEERDPPHDFVFPGGGIEEGETPEAAVVREAKEELGVDVTTGRLIGRIEFPDPLLGPSLQHFYLTEIVGGEFGTGEAPEFQSGWGGTYEPTWVNIEDLRRINIYPRLIADLISETKGQTWPALPVFSVEGFNSSRP